MYFQNEINYSKCSGHVTDNIMSFWSWKALSGRTLLSCKFSLPWHEASTLYSPLPSLPTFSLMFMAFKFSMPDVNWLFLNAPQNQNLKYAICF